MTRDEANEKTTAALETNPAIADVTSSINKAAKEGHYSIKIVKTDNEDLLAYLKVMGYRISPTKDYSKPLLEQDQLQISWD